MMPETISRAHSLRLRPLLRGAEFFAADDIVVQSCSADSRTCQPGDLFVALVGSNVDGHDYIQQAIDHGAAAVLAERYVPTAGLPVCVVNDARAAYGQICQSLAGEPSKKLKVIGVTGTNGKTSTCWLIASILQAAGFRTGLMGTIANSDSLTVESSNMTTAPPPALADWMARMVANDCSHAVLEVSSHALAQSRVAGIEFDGACITNVRRDHLDFHNSLANYREAKSRLLKQLTPGGFAILNADDSVGQQFVSLVDGAILTIGLENQAELTATIVEQHTNEQTFLLQAGSDTVPVRTKIIGVGHVYNCLTAAAVGLLYGVKLTDIVPDWNVWKKFPAEWNVLNAASHSAYLSITPTRPMRWPACSGRCVR